MQQGKTKEVTPKEVTRAKEQGPEKLSFGRFLSSWSGHPESEELFSDRGATLDNPFDSTQRISVMVPTEFENGARDVADRLKRRQPVVMNLQRADAVLSKRMVDFCAGLAYALDGWICPIADRLYLLTPNGVEVSGTEGPSAVGQEFFNQL